MANGIRTHLLVLVVALAVIFAAAMLAPPPQAQGQGQAPAAVHPVPWAYAVADAPPPAPPAPPAIADDAVEHVPDSTQSVTGKQLRDSANVFDWFPNDHPAMPQIVAHRRSPGANPWIGSCGWCHLPNGKGRPENAALAGLPAGYILEQLDDFKNGARKTGDPGKRNTATMAGNAAGLTPEEAVAAANYFASIKMTPWIKVVEGDTVPKYRNVGGFFYSKVEGDETVPLGNKIVEMPVDLELAETMRDPHTSWIAYVPAGSIKKGEDLVLRGGNGKTVACAACHGEGLKGNGNFPPLAGRSPSYLARQLYEIKAFTRNGPGTQLMRPVVEKLTEDDIMNITAYLASLQP
ncbi:MAG TPA: c-type cytochrome [Verrucomicrobiae bacterium]|jgi:cytochrome c553|nr:c-type cytochrome [Verrucomicrobiae bacterium]